MSDYQLQEEQETWDAVAAQRLRFAVVTGARRVEEVAAYLPNNYRVLDSRKHDGRLLVLVSGSDNAGWTMGDYVSPRLASGLMGCEEIREAAWWNESRFKNDVIVKTDFMSGDWLYSEKGYYTTAYAGEISGAWSGGCNFLTTKAVVERIVADQDDVIATFAPVDGTPDPCEWDTFTWDGDVLVVHPAQGDEDYRIKPEADGRYEVSFGWTWVAMEADDKLIGDIVHFDGTVEVRTSPY